MSFFEDASNGSAQLVDSLSASNDPAHDSLLPEVREDLATDEAPPSTERPRPLPRPSSRPPRSSPPAHPASPPRSSPPTSWSREHPSSPPPRSWPPRAHEDLQGAAGVAVTFRPARLNAAEVPADLVCRFQCEGVPVGPLQVIDLSTAGFSAVSPEEPALSPGSILESLELVLGDRPVWVGDAVVVHASTERFGARFTSGLLDIHHLRLGATLEGRLAIRREQAERLPATWRAAVGDLRHLLEDARAEVEEFERVSADDPLRRRDEEAQLFDTLSERWGQSYYEALTRLHEMSRGFDKRTVVLGRSYASSMLMPILASCLLHKRAYEKPLGYAGDYRMMELCFADEPVGEGLFGRFLFSISQRSSLFRAAVARERVLREALHGAVQKRGGGTDPLRVLAVAAGPGIELRRWLHETRTLDRPVQLILLDQDRGAHESAHRELTRILLERHHGMLPVTVRCLHFSVSQLIRPRTPEEKAVVSEALADLDLVYSTGLYDYLPDPVAQRLTKRLYSLLRPGGRMLLGNMVEGPDITWIMEYALDWAILYRTEQDMLRLGQSLGSRPPRLTVTPDATGGCVFLDVES
jgi:extracellular factor (EF) 3-hydroxypalmitic acid methyl ester biosynthesis protein